MCLWVLAGSSNQLGRDVCVQDTVLHLRLVDCDAIHTGSSEGSHEDAQDSTKAFQPRSVVQRVCKCQLYPAGWYPKGTSTEICTGLSGFVKSYKAVVTTVFLLRIFV